MAKQKIILEVDMSCDKCKTKAKVIIAGTKGVNSLAIEGDIRAVVIGERIDAAVLVDSLRTKLKKTVNFISIEEVKPVNPEKEKEEKKKKEDEEKKKKEEEENKKKLWGWPGYPYYGYNYALYPPPPGYDVVSWGNSIFPACWIKWYAGE